MLVQWSAGLGRRANFAQNVTLSPNSPRPDQPRHTLVWSLPHLNSPFPLMVNLKLKFLCLDGNCDPGCWCDWAAPDLVLTRGRARGEEERSQKQNANNQIKTSLIFFQHLFMLQGQLIT